MNSQFNIIIGILCLTGLVDISLGQDCSGALCPGPLKYYESLGCKPIYENPGDCCAIKYDCDHVKSRPIDKCTINGHEYDIGEHLKPEDAEPCDKGCFCQMKKDIAQFTCAIVDCFHPNIPDQCYQRRNVSSCCPSELICPENPGDRPTCEVDGKIYLDGEPFTIGKKRCFCGPGFSNENSESFCRTPKRDLCRLELRYLHEIKNNCPPVFYDHQSPQTDCGISYRCENPRDTIVKRDGNGSSEVQGHSDLKCSFGNMTLSLGDSLMSGTNYDSVCVDCMCEVPPMLTCRRMTATKCDLSKHVDFST